MLARRWGTVVAVHATHPGRVDLTLSLGNTSAGAIAYPDLVGPVAAGDRVLVNTTAVDLGLGTGGAHIVIAVDRETDPTPPTGHAMKLRYTPHQIAVDAVEEAHPAALRDAVDLDGCPVVILGLHSHLWPVLDGLRFGRRPRAAYVMTDAAALVLGFSRAVSALRDQGALVGTVTAGQAMGGDLEAVNAYSGLMAARAVLGADAIIIGMGPGNLGTNSALGFAALEVADLINAVDALGGRPIVVARVSEADQRERHRGVSHHTRTALTLARARCTLPVPTDLPAALRPVVDQHDIAEVDAATIDEVLARGPRQYRSMGRELADDPAFFRIAVAAGLYAASLLG